MLSRFMEVNGYFLVQSTVIVAVAIFVLLHKTKKMLQNRPRPLSFRLSVLVVICNHFTIQPYIAMVQKASLSKTTKRKSMESSAQTMSLV